jgi:hypothetical protein
VAAPMTLTSRGACKDVFNDLTKSFPEQNVGVKFAVFEEQFVIK